MVSISLAPESFKLSLRPDGTALAYPQSQVDQMALCAARGDCCGVQLLIHSDTPIAVLLTQAPWFSVSLSRKNLRISANGPFPVTIQDIGMLLDDEGILRADPLLVTDAVELEGGALHSFYVSIPVPEDTIPGVYSVSLEVFSSNMFSEEILEQTLTVDISVVDVLLPGKDRFMLDLWQHSGNIARKHDVTLWSDAHFQVLEGYVRSLAELGQKSVTVVASQVPWAGQSCFQSREWDSNLFEYSMILVERLEDGSLQCDYSPMDRYIRLCADNGISREIEVFGLVSVWGNPEDGFGPLAADYDDNIRVRCYDRATKRYTYLRSGAEIEEYIRMLCHHFSEMGVLDKVRLVADEPVDPVRYQERLERLRTIEPRLRMKAAVNHADFVKLFSDQVDAFAPFLECVSNEFDALKQAMLDNPQKDFVWYLCCWPQTFNTFLRSDLLETRYIGTLTALLGYQGFLRWNYTVWPKDPRKDIRYGPFPAGDLNFVYPGANGRPLLSLRYHQLKRGIEDFCLIQEAKEHGLTDTVDRVYALLSRCPDPRKIYTGKEILAPEDICSHRWEDYEQGRHLLLEALSKQI